jgi:phosphohistidine phosphatase
MAPRRGLGAISLSGAMAQQLWFLRHGEAEPHDARPDPQRRLTPRGEEQARAAGRALQRAEVPIHAVFASPKVRAWDTATLACAELASGLEPLPHQPLAEGFTRDEALALLHGVEGDQRVLVVGHNPDFEQVIHDLTGARLELRKGALAGVRVRGGRAELRALLQPRELLALAAGAASADAPLRA